MSENLLVLLLFGIFFLANSLLLGTCLQLTAKASQQIAMQGELNLA